MAPRSPCCLRISAYHRIVAPVANVAGPARDRRTEPYWNAVVDNPAAIRFNRKLVGPAGGGGIAHIKGHARIMTRSLASHGGRCEHGDRDQSSRQELDVVIELVLLALDGAATLARFFNLGQANLPELSKLPLRLEKLS